MATQVLTVLSARDDDGWWDARHTHSGAYGRVPSMHMCRTAATRCGTQWLSVCRIHIHTETLHVQYMCPHTVAVCLQDTYTHNGTACVRQFLFRQKRRCSRYYYYGGVVTPTLVQIDKAHHVHTQWPPHAHSRVCCWVAQ